MKSVLFCSVLFNPHKNAMAHFLLDCGLHRIMQSEMSEKRRKTLISSKTSYREQHIRNKILQFCNASHFVMNSRFVTHAKQRYCLVRIYCNRNWAIKGPKYLTEQLMLTIFYKYRTFENCRCV